MRLPAFRFLFSFSFVLWLAIAGGGGCTENPALAAMPFAKLGCFMRRGNAGAYPFLCRVQQVAWARHSDFDVHVSAEV